MNKTKTIIQIEDFINLAAEEIVKDDVIIVFNENNAIINDSVVTSHVLGKELIWCLNNFGLA